MVIKLNATACGYTMCATFRQFLAGQVEAAVISGASGPISALINAKTDVASRVRVSLPDISGMLAAPTPNEEILINALKRALAEGPNMQAICAESQLKFMTAAGANARPLDSKMKLSGCKMAASIVIMINGEPYYAVLRSAKGGFGDVADITKFQKAAASLTHKFIIVLDGETGSLWNIKHNNVYILDSDQLAEMTANSMSPDEYASSRIKHGFRATVDYSLAFAGLNFAPSPDSLVIDPLAANGDLRRIIEKYTTNPKFYDKVPKFAGCEPLDATCDHSWPRDRCYVITRIPAATASAIPPGYNNFMSMLMRNKHILGGILIMSADFLTSAKDSSVRSKFYTSMSVVEMNVFKQGSHMMIAMRFERGITSAIRASFSGREVILPIISGNIDVGPASATRDFAVCNRKNTFVLHTVDDDSGRIRVDTDVSAKMLPTDCYVENLCGLMAENVHKVVGYVNWYIEKLRKTYADIFLISRKVDDSIQKYIDCRLVIAIFNTAVVALIKGRIDPALDAQIAMVDDGRSDEDIIGVLTAAGADYPTARRTVDYRIRKMPIFNVEF